jgi:hypothetical protein
MDLLLLLATSYSYSYSTTTADTSGISLISSLISLALSVVVLVAEWKIFTKAGEEGWKCLIPIYNVYVLSKIVGISFWYILLCFIPFGALAWIIMMMVALAKSFGKSGGFAVGLILLSPIFTCILGFGDAKYIGPKGEAQAAAAPAGGQPAAPAAPTPQQGDDWVNGQNGTQTPPAAA